MLAQRRKLLQYLRRADFDAYAKMLSALGLKDRYMKQVTLYALLIHFKSLGTSLCSPTVITSFVSRVVDQLSFNICVLVSLLIQHS